MTAAPEGIDSEDDPERINRRSSTTFKLGAEFPREVVVQTSCVLCKVSKAASVKMAAA